MRLAEMLTDFLHRSPEPSKRYDRAIKELERVVALIRVETAGQSYDEKETPSERKDESHGDTAPIRNSH